jgi:desulfoferrodoxin-like iron-binding protein
MKKGIMDRREFLNVAAMGIAVAAADRVVSAAEKDNGKIAAKAPAVNLYVCSVCGHIEFGGAPEFCPVCHAAQDNFQQNNTVFTEAEAKNKDGAAKHVPVITAKKQSALVPEQPCCEIAVRIGKALHPMEDAHRIRFIDCYIDDKYVSRVLLTVGTVPAVTFYPKATGSKVRIVELCTVHGHWQAETEIK